MRVVWPVPFVRPRAQHLEYSFSCVFSDVFYVSDYAVAAYVLLLCRGCVLLLWVDAA